MIKPTDGTITLTPGEYKVSNDGCTQICSYPIKQGIYTELSSEGYHGDKNSISRSALMDFKKSPRKYWSKHLNPNRPPNEMKESWGFGTAFHTLILEPHLFSYEYFIMPKKVLKRENPEQYEIYKEAEKNAENTDRKVLPFADYERLLAMQASLYGNPRAKELIEGAVYESSYFWKDEASGLMVKSRPDILHKNMYVDLKTISDSSQHAYQKEMALYGYHIQAAMVEEGVLKLRGDKLLASINICVEKYYPHSIATYIIEEEAVEAGRKEYKSLLLDMNSCIVSGDFHDLDSLEIGLPGWYQSY